MAAQPVRKPEKERSTSSREGGASTPGDGGLKAMAQARTGGRYQLPLITAGSHQLKVAPISPNILVEPYK